MTAESIAKKLKKKVRFFTDGKGRRTHAVLPIKEYEELLEDIHDSAVAESRESDKPISLEQFKKRLRAKAKIPRTREP
jgi:hypothetical protein